eukprot:GFUD01001913.1.p1 GENE.GFUD01001913.1~~GFUD01001913.1.p1  ORF type:complete len:228 (-),score=60.01 GFUD01001913.1:97-780(-)
MGISSHCYLLSSIHTQITMSASKVLSAWTSSWDSLPSFQDLSAAIGNPKDMYAKFGENSNIMPEMERVLADMQERLTKLQESAGMDSTLQSMKTNVDQLLELFRDASGKLQDSNNKLIQSTLVVFCDITKELSQKIKEATSEMENSKSPREFFTQPQVKAALQMFGDQLDWINQLLEAYMKDAPIVDSGSKAPATKAPVSKAPIAKVEEKKAPTSRMSFKSKITSKK